jgi:hypothetical protein
LVGFFGCFPSNKPTYQRQRNPGVVLVEEELNTDVMHKQCVTTSVRTTRSGQFSKVGRSATQENIERRKPAIMKHGYFGHCWKASAAVE